MNFTERTCLLLTIPLSKERFDSDLKRAYSSWYFGRPKDFIKIETARMGNSWKIYQEQLASKIVSELYKLNQQTQCVIDYDVTMKQFSRALASDQFDHIFLIAHHFSNEKGEYIEFSDGGTSFETLMKVIEKGGANKSLFLFVCDSQTFEKNKNEKFESLNYLGVAGWKMPVVSGVRFIKLWICNMKEYNSNKAYSKSIEQFLNMNKV